MKKYSIYTLVLSLFTLGACAGLGDMKPEGNTQLDSQLDELYESDPSRADALCSGMYTKLGAPDACVGNGTPDDYGFIMIAFSSDLEAADALMPNSGYNWFSVCGELSSRNANYRNPLIRYKIPYDVIGSANTVITSLDSASTSVEIRSRIGWAYALRAFSYLNLAPYFQFSYETSKDLPCVPIVTEKTEDFTHNPRATVGEVYDLIISDLGKAIDYLQGWERSDKGKIDRQVAFGLRARAYLNMGEWAKAAQDADSAMVGYVPASILEVSTPFLYDINEHNWMWGYDMTTNLAAVDPYATTTSWLRPFSGDGYAPACQCYCMINSLLYDKIPDNDVRKGWWVDSDLKSPLLEGLTWGDLSGQKIASGTIDGVKEQFLPYTNVKFGVFNLGTATNDEDWCWMRVEEMILIKAEGLLKSGQPEMAAEVLNDFVANFRCPGYNCTATGRSLSDEIWFQRRVELWGEGFSNNDTRRLGKPLVRFHDANNNYPEAFRFNMTPDDGWWLMRFPQTEMNTNASIVDNTEGSIPRVDQNPDLKDGVTD